MEASKHILPLNLDDGVDHRFARPHGGLVLLHLPLAGGVTHLSKKSVKSQNNLNNQMAYGLCKCNKAHDEII